MIIFPVYENFEVASEYKESYIRLESSINQSSGEHSFFTLGAAFFKQEITPTMINGLHAKGHKQGYEMFAKWSRYSLNRHSFTQKGQNLTTEITWFLGQDHSIGVLTDDESSHDLPDLNISIKNFLRMKLNWESFIPVNQRITYFTHLQAGYNYRYFQDFIHAFNLGGTHPFLRDQITFTGLNEFGIITSYSPQTGNVLACLNLGWSL